MYCFDVSGAYGYSIKMNASSSALRFNNNWEGAGTDRMVLADDGALYTTNNVWHNSMEGLGRVHYSSSATTYLKGHGTTPIIFRNGADSDIANINSGGLLYSAGGLYTSGSVGAAGGLLDFNPYGQFNIYGQIRFGCGQWQAGSYAQIRFDTAGSVHDGSTYIRHATNGYSRFDTYIISGGQQFPSDIRIKKNIIDINDDTALQLLLRIEPKSYDYIDIDKGAENVYGFIAQQVKEVVPNAIKIVGEVLPNILEYGTYNNKVITFPNNTNIILQVGDTIRIDYKIHKRNWCEIINVFSINSFEIKEIDVEIPMNEEVYVYGTMVKDFHTVDKNYIYTLNVCATQELHRRIEAQKVIIQSQEDRIKELETKMAQILNNMSQ